MFYDPRIKAGGKDIAQKKMRLYISVKAMLIAVYTKMNDIKGYKIAKPSFETRPDNPVIKEITEPCGSDPDKAAHAGNLTPHDTSLQTQYTRYTAGYLSGAKRIAILQLLHTGYASGVKNIIPNWLYLFFPTTVAGNNRR